jgi:hypothetical protein
MSDWTSDELERIGAADELQVTTARRDGSLRRWVPIWVVRAGDDLYVRSYRGAGGAWYRHAVLHRQGRIRAGGIERAVAFEQPGESIATTIDNAYRAKYAHYGESYLQPMLNDQASAATLRLMPTAEKGDQR